MQSHLNPLLDRLGLKAKPRYSLEETAEIIGIRRDQVLDLLKRGKLIGVRASERRWGGIIAADLDDYIGRVNAPWVQRRHASSTKPGVMTTLVPTQPPVPMTSPGLPPLPVPRPSPINHDPSGPLPIDETPNPPRTLRPKLNF
jgi:hypothetical protein